MSIDPKLFTVESLIESFLDDGHGNYDMWRQMATIVPDYMPPYPREDTRPKCVVRYKDSFLRHSSGPRQGHFWDCYGDDYITPELAFMALLEAPVPPFIIKKEIWEERRKMLDAT